MKRVAVLIIDAQNDFCDPNGSLFVKGAVEDNQRLSRWIDDNKESIGFIGCTLDSHQLVNISHPKFWYNADGVNPSPFTVITSSDVESGVWRTRLRPKESLEYLKSLESSGQYTHLIWPEHCVIGTHGHALEKNINEAVLNWAADGHFVNYIPKGANPFTEHFGAFQAQVISEDTPSTHYNKKLEETLNKYDLVYISGQAKTHCVANTIKQVCDNAPELAKKFVVLEDTMSNIPGGPEEGVTYVQLSERIFDEARKLGMRFSTTSQEKL